MFESPYFLDITLTNEDKGYQFSSWQEPIEDHYLKDDDSLNFGKVYRTLQKEYGRCQSSVFVDSETGPKKIGWFFVSRQQYEDTGEWYLRGCWATIGKEVEPAKEPVWERVEIS